MLALDFDGVLSDSAPEAFVVALRTWAALRPGSRLAEHRLGLSRPTRAGIQAHPLYPRFVELMPLGNRAEDYAVILAILERGAAVQGQADYDREHAAQGEVFLTAFHRSFYEQRALFSRDDADTWLSLSAAYPAFVEILRRRAADAVLALATAKDRASVQRLLRAYGIADLFAAERILDKETGVSKRAHLAALRERVAVDWCEITFVDDKLNHLESVADLGVRCVLAAWGYNGVREQQGARARGFEVCDLADAESRLFGARA